jgi:hypothetical protein
MPSTCIAFPSRVFSNLPQNMKTPFYRIKNALLGALAALTLLLITPGAFAQTTSYNLSSVPVGGLGVVAIGTSALASNAGDYNTAVGDEAMLSNTNGQQNVAIGAYAMRANPSGLHNTAVGSTALMTGNSYLFCTAIGAAALYSNNGNYNTAIGARSMQMNTSGTQNTAVGSSALNTNTSTSNHTAIGYEALYSNTTGVANTAVGHKALRANSTGGNNAVLGGSALVANTSGSDNSAFGANALYSNTVGTQNTAVGARALYTNTGTTQHTAIGYEALYSNTDGTFNTAVGHSALRLNTTGSNNAALGRTALSANTTGFSNSAFGYGALSICTTGYNNTAVGSYASSTSATFSNLTALGNNAISNNNNKMRFGNTSVTKVEGQVAYSIPSDGRFKTDVREDDVKGLDFIQRLRPVVYNFDTRRFTEFLTQDMPDSLRQHYLADDFGPSTAIRQSGFIAQEVEQAAKEAGYNFNGVSAPSHAGDNYSIAYGQFVVPIVKGMQEQQAMIEKQQAQIAELQALVHKLSQPGTITSDKAPAATAELAQPIQVFPNPSHGRFTLRIAPEWTGVLEVYDMRGRSVMRQTLLPGNPEYQLDLTAQPKGSYLLQLDGRDGTHLTEKLIIE